MCCLSSAYFRACDGLDVCAPHAHSCCTEILMPNVMVWGGKWGLWEALRPLGMGFVPFWETPQRCLAPSTLWGHSQQVPALGQEEGPQLTLLAPRSWPSSLRDCEKSISVLLYKLPRLWFCYSSQNRLRHGGWLTGLVISVMVAQGWWFNSMNSFYICRLG